MTKEERIRGLWKYHRELTGENDADKAKEVRDAIAKIRRSEHNPLAVGIGSGMKRVGQDLYGLGVGAGELMGLTDEGAFTDYRDEVREDRAMMDPLKEDTMWASGGEVLGEIAAGAAPFGFAGITGATAKQIPNFAGRLATNMGIGATQGALGADDPLEGAMWGAGGAAVGEVAGDFMRLMGKGDMPNVPHYMEDVNVMRADDPGSLYAPMERAAEFLPFGRDTVVKARQKQQEQLKEGVGRLVNEYDEGLGLGEISESFRRRQNERKDAAGNLYDEVATQMEGVSPGAEWKEEIADIVIKLKADPEPLQDKALITRLENYITGNELPDWNELRRLRSLISRDVSDTYKGGALTGTTDTPSLMQAKEVVTGALDDSASRETGDLWRAADSNYRTEVMQPYKDTPSIVRDIMSVQSPEQMVDKILSKNVANNPTLVGHVMAAMDEPGKIALRTEMLQRAFAESAEGSISPAKAANFIHSKREVFEKTFPGENIGELVAFLRHIKGAGSAGDIPMTGMGGRIAEGMIPKGTGGMLGMGGLGAAASIGPEVLMMTGGSMVGSAVLGHILGAVATGKPGALGEVIKMMGKALPPTGRLVGSEIPTDE